MAARKKAAKASKATKFKLNSRPNWVFKRNSSARVAKSTKMRFSRGILKVQRHKVRLLENGLVDMSKTPPWLARVAKRNTKKSLLLRLPGEIRNKIYHYAMTGNVVKLALDEDRTLVHAKTWVVVEAFYKGHTVDMKDEHNSLERLDTVRKGEPAIKSAFHLPEVCRQIYTEAATLAYPGTIFYLETGPGATKDFKLWSSTLLPAQRNAITDIAMTELKFAQYLPGTYPPPFRTILPGIKRLHVSRQYSYSSRRSCDMDREEINDHNDKAETFEEWAQDQVRQIENADVEVIFHPKQP